MGKITAVKELQKKLSKYENVFILDVRPTDQRKKWKIADSIHVDAYKQLNAGDDTAPIILLQSCHKRHQTI